MSNIPILNLPVAISVSGNEQIPAVQNGTTVRVPLNLFGATSPGGSNTQVQYNNNGVFGGATLTFNNGNGVVSNAGGTNTPLVSVTFNATSMLVNCALSNVFSTILTNNVTVAPTMSDPSDGQTINWFLVQDGTGSRTMTWPTSFKWQGGTPGVLSTAAGAVDLLVGTYLVSTGNWYVSLLKNFS